MPYTLDRTKESILIHKLRIGSCAMFCVGSPYSLYVQSYEFGNQRLKMLYNFETSKDKNLKFRT